MLTSIFQRLTDMFVITPLKLMGYALGMLYVIYSIKELSNGHFTAFVLLALTVIGVVIYRKRNPKTPEPVYDEDMNW